MNPMENSQSWMLTFSNGAWFMADLNHITPAMLAQELGIELPDDDYVNDPEVADPTALAAINPHDYAEGVVEYQHHVLEDRLAWEHEAQVAQAQMPPQDDWIAEGALDMNAAIELEAPIPNYLIQPHTWSHNWTDGTQASGDRLESPRHLQEEDASSPERFEVATPPGYPMQAQASPQDDTEEDGPRMDEDSDALTGDHFSEVHQRLVEPYFSYEGSSSIDYAT